MATTKEDLIRYFSTLDISTLEKLRKYSELLIIPDEDLLTDATMTQMVSKAHTLANSLFPEWTDRSKTDFGEFLVELFALFSEKDFWYINAFANEGIFKKMRSYSNAFSKAISLGYSPATCKGASASFSVVFAPTASTVRYYRGDLVIAVDGKYFSNDEEFTVSPSAGATSKTLTLYEGKQVTEDTAYNGYNVYLSKSNIDLNSVTVVIGKVRYTRVKNFGDSLPDSTHFMLLPEHDGSCSIFFGSGGFGVQPSLGTLVSVEYRTCDGAAGNINIGTAEISQSLSEAKATQCVMLSSAGGGQYPESLDSIKEKAPAYFAGRSAAINEKAAEAILNSYPFVYQSKVYCIGNDVYYMVIPTSGYGEPTSSEKEYMRANFEPCLMLGFNGNQLSNTYVDFVERNDCDSILLDVIASSGYDTSAIASEIRQIMEDLTNPLIGATYEQTFSKAAVEVQIRSAVAGVQSVAFKKVQSGVQSIIEDFTLGPSEIFKTINQNKLNININVI